MKRFFIGLFLALTITFSANAGNFTAKVNRNHVPLGETFVLTLQYDDAPGTSEPDLTPLQKDFNIYSVGRDYQSTIINGQASHTYQWNVVLSPKVENVATIPSISFKNFSSSPIDITVAAAAPEQKQNISMSYDISNSEPYLQEQIIYTLTIKTSENLQGSLPQFVDDGSQSWIIKQISEPAVDTEIDNGIESKTVTIRYALFPQKSGVLSIPQMRLHAYYPDKNRGRPASSLFSAFFNEDLLNSFGFNNMKKVDLTTKPQTIEVRAIPSENNGYWWLPSQQVTISSDWDNKLPEFKAGEPASRRITLTAAGIIDTQLPKLSFKEVAGLKQYPEKPEVSSYVTQNGIISQMNINVVYIPEKDGVLNIPEIIVPWYNLDTEQMDRAQLSAQQINAENNPSISVASNNITIQKNQSQLNPEHHQEKQDVFNVKIYALLAASFILGLLFSWMILRNKHTTIQNKIEPVTSKEVPSTIGKNAKEVRDIILNWAKANYPKAKILNLDDVENLVADKKFSEILQQIKKDLYSGKKQGFDSQELEKLMHEHSLKKKKSSKKEQSLLPDLYK